MHLLILGGTPEARRRAAHARVPAGHTPLVLDAVSLPFVRARDIPLPSGPRVILVHDIERAFPAAQINGIRLVLTQSTYLLQTWLDRLEHDDLVVVTADEAALEANAPEALRHRGPWRGFQLQHLDGSPQVITITNTEEAASPQSPAPVATAALLATGFAQAAASERALRCREAVAIDPASAVARLALASACREINDAPAARDALDRALALSPDFEAAHYESAKLWLAWDDLPRARDGFRRAAELMPRFAAAFSNLGATLGELDDPASALDAFEHALAGDPDSHTLLNNIGVVSRETGQLARSEAALRRVVELAPEFVFGHYNLGHTLFLAGRYDDALRAYEAGYRLDPQKNRRQACRMALARLACGDSAGAERDLWAAAGAAPREEREDLLLEAYEVAHAWLAQHPERDSAASRAFVERVGAEIIKS